MNEFRPVVRCIECKLNQFYRQNCRRCRKLLPIPNQADLPAVDWSNYFCSLPALPTMDVMKEHLMREAVRRYGSRVVAAKVIGIGKTTMFRSVKKELRESKSA